MNNPLLWKWIVKHNYNIECIKFLLKSIRGSFSEPSKNSEQFLDLCPSIVRKGIEHKMRQHNIVLKEIKWPD